MFGTLTCIWCLAINRKKSFLLIALLGVSYGIAMEFVQRYCIPHRSFDVWDIVADAAGCVAGYYFAKRYINRKQGI